MSKFAMGAYGIDRPCGTEAGSRKADHETDPLRTQDRESPRGHDLGDRLYIGTANVNRQWVRNVQKTPRISLSVAGESSDGTARFLTDRAEHERAMAAIRRKYWMFRRDTPNRRARLAPRRVGRDARQYGVVRGRVGRLDEASQNAGRMVSRYPTAAL